MADNKKFEEMAEDLPETYTLTDEEGNEFEVELLASFEFEGKQYKASTPVDVSSDKKGGDQMIEYDILEVSLDDEGEEILTSIEDDEEFDKVADFFDDAFFGEVDYDA
ncbi:MAG: DUF1292 domain-containing protein [Clostridia bacterium]|nr:DUF1292 domain-containing protein [Clostridia bacterium]